MSRELDAEVAEEVMGWARHDDGLWYPPGIRMACKMPHYSTDIADAWSVVETMAERGYWCQMRTPFEGYGKGDYWAGFTPHSTTGWNGTPDHWTQAEWLPVAICRAALAAVREKEA